MSIEICYCYYKPFHSLPNRKWKKFKTKEKAQAFVSNFNRNKFLWCILVNGKEVSDEWIQN